MVWSTVSLSECNLMVSQGYLLILCWNTSSGAVWYIISISSCRYCLPSFEKLNMGWVEMPHWWECLLCKSDDLSSYPQHLCKKLGRVTYIQSAVGAVETGGSSQISELWVHKRPLNGASRNKLGERLRKTIGIDRQIWHALEHMCTHTQLNLCV